MELVIVAALALALGFVLGIGVGALRAWKVAAHRRAAAGTSAVLARIWPDTLPARSPSDILAGIIRVTLGGQSYVLPVLPRRDSRAWLERMDAEFGDLADALNSAETPDILRLLAAQTDRLYDLLLAYDTTGQLPTRDSDLDFATEPEILRATLEVWAALHPLAVTLVNMPTSSPTSGTSSEPPSSLRSPSAGAPTTSTAS